MDLEKETWSADSTTQFYEVSPKTLAQWVKRGFPKAARGKYPILSGFRWYKKFVLGQVNGQATDLATERLLRERARRKLDELKAEQAAGRLVDRDQAIFWVKELVIEVKQNFLALPRRFAESLAPVTDPKIIEEILREEIRRILFDMSQPRKKEVRRNGE